MTTAPPTHAPTAGRFVGQRIQRREDPRLLSGRGTYVDDFVVRGALHAAFLRSQVARGTITRLDVEAARALPGVVAVFTASDLARYANMDGAWHDLGPPKPGEPLPPFRVLADGDVRFVGDPIAVVVAESRYLAEDGCELIDLDIEPLAPVLDVDLALAEGADLVHPEHGSNAESATKATPDPELDEIFADAEHVITETFGQHRYINVPMETRGCVADWDAPAGQLTVHLATQGPHGARAFLARVLDVPENQVRVIMGDVGGGFGQKMFVMQEELAAVLASRALGRPVKWIEDRQENLVAGHHAREDRLTISLALDGDGRILAGRAHLVEDLGAFPVGGSAAGFIATVWPGPYKIPKVGFSSDAVYTNTCGRCAYRGPWLTETVAREEMMDLVARRLGIDPLELRRRNVLQTSELPFKTATGMVYDSITPAETLEQAAEIIGYEAFRAGQDQARRDGRLLGIGLSLFVEPSGMAFGTMSSEAATVRVGTNGMVEVAVGCASHGQSLETTIVQVVAEALGVDVDVVTLVQGDTSATPYGGGVGGSRSAVIYNGAAVQAAVEVRAKVVEIAAHLLEVSADDLVVEQGVVSVRGNPTSKLSLVEIARTAYAAPDRLPAGMSAGLEAAARFRPGAPITWANAAHACIVEVDPLTGAVDVQRFVVSEDCGKMVNPNVVEGQIAGGVVQGIGGVLLEHFVYDGDGNPLTTTFLDYLIPTATEVPTIEYGHIETPAPTNPGGHKGLGEGGAIGAPPAVFNAVMDALAHLGVSTADQPLGPAQVVELLERAGR